MEADIDGVVISNISIEDADVPIFIRLGNRARSMATATPGSLKNISIQNVTATGAALTSSITGVEGGRVQNVIIDGFTVTAKGAGGLRALDDVPEVPGKYPLGRMFWGASSARAVRQARGRTHRAEYEGPRDTTRPASVIHRG